MRLHEHPDFRDALIAAGAHFSARGISAQLIEKDYYGAISSMRRTPRQVHPTLL
jgi:hypothetical protein